MSSSGHTCILHVPIQFTVYLPVVTGLMMNQLTYVISCSLLYEWLLAMFRSSPMLEREREKRERGYNLWKREQGLFQT